MKDRARPFSRKHFRYWMTAAGGMVIIMLVNVAIGFWMADDRPAQPVPKYLPIPASKLPIDAGVDASVTPPEGGSLPGDVER